MITFESMLQKLSNFWNQQGCVTHQGYDLEVGAGTSNPATFLRCLGPEPYKAFYIEPCRRPGDSRYGENPARNYHYFQGQVILKPSPPDVIELCLKSLEAIGIDLSKHDIRFVHDDWENPTLGAWGLGWEVWMDGMEVIQFTYFQSVGGQILKPVTSEITYGLERLCMYLQKVNSIMDIQWNEDVTYRDLYFQNEVEWSHYNLEEASVEMWFKNFDTFEKEAKQLLAKKLPLPAYDFVLKSSHAFNILDARGAISVTERARYIGRIRDLSREIAEGYVEKRKELGYPLMGRFKPRLTADEIVHIPSKKTPEDKSGATLSESGDFLLEIGSEELPATFVPIGCKSLEKSIKNLLEKEGVAYQAIKIFGTPRRLAAQVIGIQRAKPKQLIQKRGPALTSAFDESGKPLPAAEGFFRSIDKPSFNLDYLKKGKAAGIRIENVKGTDYLFAEIEIPGRLTADLLAEHLPDLILGLDFPKKMRWGDQDITYARPIRWIVALLDHQIIPFHVGDTQSGRESFGHRQICNWNFALVKAQDYVKVLKEHCVLVDIVERQKKIVGELDQLEKKLGAKIIEREEVLKEVVHLTEWPEVTPMQFDRSFLRAPKEVLISEMVKHQRYFPVAGSDGELKNTFIITANVKPTDQIREGNLKVLSARLTDGVFLYEQGLKTTLEKRNEKLKLVTFQKDLGTVYEKVERLIKHAEGLQKHLHLSTPEKVKRAALLSKSDLASEMVFEFPELQGTIGKYYANAEGEDPDVAMAIEEQWMPRGENAPLPGTATGTILSLADKFDNLVGGYLANLKPTSSSDPYALRRQTVGIIKILIQSEKPFKFKAFLKEAMQNFPERLTSGKEALVDEIETFIVNRIKAIFADYGFRKDEIEAALAKGFDDIYDAFCKVEALHRFRVSNDKFSHLFEVYKRAKGQLAHADLPLNGNSHKIDITLLHAPEEKKLHSKEKEIGAEFDLAVGKRDYDRAYELIAELQPPLADLFKEVKILDDDLKLRQNRLLLLQEVFSHFDKLLDFSKIQQL